VSGIVGVVDLAERRLVPAGTLRAMADALIHRGPDDDGYFQQDGVSLAVRRLAISSLGDGRQPLTNEDGSIVVVCDGELFDYRERRAELEGRGHRFLTHSDAEVIPHLWEDHGERMFDNLYGQFAFALWDGKQRRLILARDRLGICPLHWTRQGDWLLFASEIKGLFASGMVPVQPDLRGINHAFTFYAIPGPITCFAGVSSVLPGHFLDTRLDGKGTLCDRVHWQLDFPDQGAEEPGADRARLVNDFEAVLLRAVERRLHADVPVTSYLSGGIDSSIVVALASKAQGRPLDTYTIQIDDPELDETSDASLMARHIGCHTKVVRFGGHDVLTTYPRLVQAAESPVIDTACAALLGLAREAHIDGYKVALSGEGADEWLTSYPWYRLHKWLSYLDIIPGLRLSQVARRAFLVVSGAPRFPRPVIRQIEHHVGGYNGWLDMYGLMSLSKLRFFSPAMRQVMNDNSPYADLQLDPERLRRWHPLNRAVALGARVQLPGLLLQAKGDRVAMSSSLQIRYPFLDEDVVAFLARLHPRWKLHGFTGKYLLRLLAERWLPRSLAWRRKTLFRAPFEGLHMDNPPAFVEQLFSPESLRKAGYFDAEAVQHWRRTSRQMRPHSTQRISVEMGLAGVFSTQLWHHLFLGGTLADLPAPA
jgi:asparagine synthase (glutamine-hydrolysing)